LRLIIFLGGPCILSLLKECRMPFSSLSSHTRWYHRVSMPPRIRPFFLGTASQPASARGKARAVCPSGRRRAAAADPDPGSSAGDLAAPAGPGLRAERPEQRRAPLEDRGLAGPPGRRSGRSRAEAGTSAQQHTGTPVQPPARGAPRGAASQRRARGHGPHRALAVGELVVDDKGRHDATRLVPCAPAGTASAALWPLSPPRPSPSVACTGPSEAMSGAD